MVGILREFFSVAHHETLPVRIVPQTVVDLVFVELLILCRVGAFQHGVTCHACQKSGSGGVPQTAPGGQPLCTAVQRFHRVRPVVQVLLYPSDVEAVVGVDRVQKQTALHHVVPAHAPRIFQFVRAQFLSQIGDVGSRLVQIGLLAGGDVQPVCRVEQFVIEVGRTVESAGITIIIGFVAPCFVCQPEQVLGVFQIVAGLVASALEGTGAGRQCRRHFTADSGVRSAEYGSGFGVVCPVVLHAVFQQLHRPPPGVIHLSVAHLINGGVALVTGGEIVQHKREVVHIGFQFAGLLQPVRVLVQSPRQHGSGIRHRQIELDMVAGIVPAAGDFVGHGGIGTPLHFVPFRKRPCLLAFIKVHGLLECLGVVGGKVRRRNRHRRQGTDTQTDCGQQSRGTCASSHLYHLPFC